MKNLRELQIGNTVYIKDVNILEFEDETYYTKPFQKATVTEIHKDYFIVFLEDWQHEVNDVPFWFDDSKPNEILSENEYESIMKGAKNECCLLFKSGEL